MHKKWLFSGLITVFLAANLLYLLPVMANPSVCPSEYKCFFNDEGNLLLQTLTSTSSLQLISGGIINLDTSTSTGDIKLKTKNNVSGGHIYLNYISANAYGLGVSPSGQLYHDGFSLVIADWATYGINISGSSLSSSNLKMLVGEFDPSQVSQNSQSFVASSDQGYWDSNPVSPAVNGLSSVYYRDDSTTGLTMTSQLAFIRDGDSSNGFRQYLQFRFNSSTDPNAWDSWHEVCDSSNNCQNFINFLDGTASGSLMMYQDPYLLMESGLKISDPNALSDCGSLNTVGGVIGCGAAGTGGGVDGSGTANYITKWSNTSTIGSSLIYDNGTNVGVGTTSPQGKLAVAGTGYFTGAVRVGTPITSSDAVDRNYVDSAISALGGGEAVTFAGVSTTTFTGNQGGYDNANSLCVAVDSASHICTTENILAIINNGNVSTIPTTTTGYWISNGPPGYTVNANDCAGFNSNSNNDFGTVWIKISNSNNFGVLQPCGLPVKFACCK